jgi:hypothetical protein
MASLRRRSVNQIMRPAGVFILAFFLFGCNDIYHNLIPPKLGSLSDENRIISFEIDGQIGKAVITSNTISVSVKEGTDLTEVIPRISVSPGAKLFPLNIAIDFSVPVDFLVTSEKGTVRKYTWISPYKAVNIAAIEGVTVPVTGVTPVEEIVETDQYTGTVTWDPAHSTFETITAEYTATITLTAKTGYTLQGVPENFFAVEGATSVINAENSGVVTVIFPVIISFTVTFDANGATATT